MLKNACNQLHLDQDTLREKCPNTEFFWSAFSRIRTGYGEILLSFMYSVRMWKIQTRKSSVFGHFSHSDRQTKRKDRE